MYYIYCPRSRTLSVPCRHCGWVLQSITGAEEFHEQFIMITGKILLKFISGSSGSMDLPFQKSLIWENQTSRKRFRLVPGSWGPSFPFRKLEYGLHLYFRCNSSPVLRALKIQNRTMVTSNLHQERHETGIKLFYTVSGFAWAPPYPRAAGEFGKIGAAALQWNIFKLVSRGNLTSVSPLSSTPTKQLVIFDFIGVDGASWVRRLFY